MIAEHKGVNAVDEWEFTPLMYAVQKSDLMLLSALLNSRKPIVDVNAMKASGYSALFYAVELKATTIMKALLRRGA
eukprot:gene4854-biopygen5192